MAILLPEPDCPRCPRLRAFREANRARWPEWFNAPVPPFGGEDAWLLIVGLAPGLRGANRTGRPFTGDFAGKLLFSTLLQCGLAAGAYRASADDGLKLIGCRLTNAVRCVPPQNKPSAEEITACRPFLAAEIDGLMALHSIVALGAIAHGAVLGALGERKAAFPFRHGARYPLRAGLTLTDSYHCSRQNTNTGRLTAEMFAAVFASVLADRPR